MTTWHLHDCFGPEIAILQASTFRHKVVAVWNSFTRHGGRIYCVIEKIGVFCAVTLLGKMYKVLQLIRQALEGV